MTTPKRPARTAAVIAAMLAPPLVLAGTAAAADDGDTAAGYPSTQPPHQVIATVGATADNALRSLADALDGDNRPDGANGTESEFPGLDLRLVEGPVGGLLVGRPLE